MKLLVLIFEIIVDYLVDLKIVNEVLSTLNFRIFNIAYLYISLTFSEKNIGHFFP